MANTEVQLGKLRTRLADLKAEERVLKSQAENLAAELKKEDIDIDDLDGAIEALETKIRKSTRSLSKRTEELNEIIDSHRS